MCDLGAVRSGATCGTARRSCRAAYRGERPRRRHRQFVEAEAVDLFAHPPHQRVELTLRRVMIRPATRPLAESSNTAEVSL